MQSTNYYSYKREDLLPFIPEGVKKTLDVGCASGVFSENLKKLKQVETWGIEMVKDVAEIAQTRLDNVLIGSFDDVWDKLPKKYFDCVFFNDVLEHMAYPEDCLKKIKDNIVPGGYIVVSLPNVRQIGIVLDLIIKGDWKYQDSGIMDKTHLRFFTKKSICRMIEGCGYEIKQIKGVHGVSRYSLTSILNLLAFNKFEGFKYNQYITVASIKE